MSYADRQQQRDAEYRRAWAAMPPEQRARLEAAGIDGPAAPDYRARSATTKDPAPTPAADMDPAPEESETAALIRRIVGELLGKNNLRLTLECMALVTGLGYTGQSMTAIAKQHGITRAAVSARCVEIQTGLGLPPSPAMKPIAARAKYSAARRRICA